MQCRYNNYGIMSNSAPNKVEVELGNNNFPLTNKKPLDDKTWCMGHCFFRVFSKKDLLFIALEVHCNPACTGEHGLQLINQVSSASSGWTSEYLEHKKLMNKDEQWICSINIITLQYNCSYANDIIN